MLEVLTGKSGSLSCNSSESGPTWYFDSVADRTLDTELSDLSSFTEATDSRRPPSIPVHVIGSGDGDRIRVSKSSNETISGGYKMPWRENNEEHKTIKFNELLPEDE